MAKQTPRKPREEWVYATTRDRVTSIEVSIDGKSGEIVFGSPMTNAYTQVTYARASGKEKVVSRIPATGEALILDPDSAVWSNYDVVFGVDTNTRSIEDRRISVTGFLEATKILAVDSAGVISRCWRFASPRNFAFADATTNPEFIGWGLALDYIRSNPAYHGFTRVGLVVDSHLSEHSKFNRRTDAVNGEWRLPERVKLVYASADTGGEYFGNFILKHADSIASQCLKQLERNPSLVPRTTHHSWPFTGLTHIYSREELALQQRSRDEAARL
jgi:hypothetical protein